MRMLLRVRIPHKEFNEAVRNGTAGTKLNRIVEETKPEASTSRRSTAIVAPS